MYQPQAYQRQVTDTFIMPTDGLSPETSKSLASMIVAIGTDGNFYALKRETPNNYESLCKAVSMAEKVNTEKRINLSEWRMLDKEFVTHSYTFQSFH